MSRSLIWFTKIYLVAVFSVFYHPLFLMANENLEKYDIYRKLGDRIDLNLTFQDETGHKKTLRDIFQGNSTLVLTLNYYRCTTMCALQLANLAGVIAETQLFPGVSPYSLATISFDPEDTTARSLEMQRLWIPQTKNPQSLWHFFVGTPQTSQALAKSLNFYYEKDQEGNYSHAAALFFLRSDGTFYRYLYGFVYGNEDFKYALKETSFGRVGSWLTGLRLIFKTYDPIRGKYL